ncbi:MAG: hypothetical protein A2675_00075 [Candidatus Yonathbacteria bacterium RIFCSPHIGHO2_01_FULL_51_10]|uniref:Uncharacterized protein n=1 Tax=Candidatus Yonathbacteria bacterium RIFCSPHIGHO2_01_FULL_51_10 TaxID=1802723 RepID=A0A1G2SAQ7_9BACT|nr:MAG: hypothetical protein A2675_00075 [Candidatus Yonathbacteria bacterium RIFCSPHIGHO2_01_FULL_51_10]
MNPETLTLIKDRIALLPQAAHDYVTGASWADPVKNIASQNELNEEQSGGLLLEFILVLVGLSHEEDYVTEVRERLGLTEELAQKISADTLALVHPVTRASLKELCEKELAAESSVSATPTTYVVPTPPTPPPTPAPADMPASIFEEKLKRVFTMPSSTGNAPSMPPSPGSSAGADPYREPTA